MVQQRSEDAQDIAQAEAISLRNFDITTPIDIAAAARPFGNNLVLYYTFLERFDSLALGPRMFDLRRAPNSNDFNQAAIELKE